jgi:endonuclease-3
MPTKKHPKLSALEVMSYLEKDYGTPKWELRYDPTFELIYTILSQHTSDINSERAFKSLVRKFKTVEAISNAKESEIEIAIRMGGLSKIKAPRIKQVLNQIYAELKSFDLWFLKEMPMNEAKNWLKNLPGVGPKTAAIILCFSLGMPAMPVDTHIFRVSKRLGLIGQKVNADAAHDILEPMVDPNNVFAFHMQLIQHGRTICKAIKPKCKSCVISERCPSSTNN